MNASTPHETVVRLFAAAKDLKELVAPADVARALNVSDQTLNNWSRRGMSKEGLLLAQERLGISATWIKTGVGAAAAEGAEHTSAPTDKTIKKPNDGMIEGLPADKAATVDLLTHHVGNSRNFRRVYVVGRAQGGLPERIWTDGDHLVGAIDEYAELATTDPQAFICPVVGDSMYPRFMPGEYVLVEPNTTPQIGGTVLVRLSTGETMLKRLEHRAAGHIRLASWNDPVQHTFREDQISWMYYVAHSVPPEKIKMRF